MTVVTAVQKAITKYGHRVLRQLAKVTGNHLDPEPTDHKWPIWKIITIGGKSFDELLDEIGREELFSEGVTVTWGAKDIMRQETFTTLPEPQTIPLVRLAVADLGFIDLPITEEVFHVERLHSLGLNLCPAEVGPHLWLQYQAHLEERERLAFLVMEPIHGSIISSLSLDYGRVFVLYNKDGKERELCIAPAGPSLFWSLDTKVIVTLSPSHHESAHKQARLSP